MHPARRPFEGCAAVAVVPPSAELAADDEDAAWIRRLPALLAHEGEALRRELGAPIVVATRAPEQGPTWLLGPAHLQPAIDIPPATAPTLHLDRQRKRLISDGPDLEAVVETFAGLRTLARHPGGPLVVSGARSWDDAVERILVEVHDTWPSFRLRGKDWATLSRPHIWRVRGASSPATAIHAMQRWLAELDDFHTWVRPVQTSLVLPYGAWVAGARSDVVLTNVLPWTAGWAHGVRPGWQLVGLDVASAWHSTPAAPHSKPLLVARRLLSGAAGEVRTIEARGPNGAWARWDERFEPPTGAPAVWDRLPSDTGYLWIGAWVPGVEDVIDEALTALAGTPLIVDLRGNGGGRLSLAHDFRDRFLDRPTRCGWIRTTEPGGRPGDLVPIDARPSEKPRWTSRVRFLTNPLTWSSAEDALLGLQGLPHVQVWGEPSGGGSGRTRRIRLLPGWRLTISSALTWDRRGWCVEGQGIPVDRLVHIDRARPDGSDPVLRAAERSRWTL